MMEIGSVMYEYLGENNDSPHDLMAYVQVPVRIDGHRGTVWLMVGVPPHLHGTVRAAGPAAIAGCLSAWDADLGEGLRRLSRRRREDLEDALADEAQRLWRETLDMRRWDGLVDGPRT